jgi:hypothetical protein
VEVWDDPSLNQTRTSRSVILLDLERLQIPAYRSISRTGCRTGSTLIGTLVGFQFKTAPHGACHSLRTPKGAKTIHEDLRLVLLLSERCQLSHLAIRQQNKRNRLLCNPIKLLFSERRRLNSRAPAGTRCLLCNHLPRDFVPDFAVIRFLLCKKLGGSRRT